jgi:hypothetical protein
MLGLKWGLGFAIRAASYSDQERVGAEPPAEAKPLWDDVLHNVITYYWGRGGSID